MKCFVSLTETVAAAVVAVMTKMVNREGLLMSYCVAAVVPVVVVVDVVAEIASVWPKSPNECK